MTFRRWDKLQILQGKSRAQSQSMCGSNPASDGRTSGFKCDRPPELSKHDVDFVDVNMDSVGLCAWIDKRCRLFLPQDRHCLGKLAEQQSWEEVDSVRSLHRFDMIPTKRFLTAGTNIIDVIHRIKSMHLAQLDMSRSLIECCLNRN